MRRNIEEINVKIPKPMVDFLEKKGLLKHYIDIEDFVLESVRVKAQTLILQLHK